MTSYGKVKVNTITFDNSGTATDVPVSTIAVDSDLALKADLSSPTFTGTINGGNLVKKYNSHQHLEFFFEETDPPYIESSHPICT